MPNHNPAPVPVTAATTKRQLRALVQELSPMLDLDAAGMGKLYRELVAMRNALRHNQQTLN